MALKATLIVYDTHCQCSACEQDADPRETSHRTVLSTGEPARCGARFRDKYGRDLHDSRDIHSVAPNLPIAVEPPLITGSWR